MQWENTRNRYGVVAQGLHAGVALLFLGAFGAVYGRRWFTVPETAENFALLQLHLSLGWSILLLAVLRLWWRSRSRVAPVELPGARIEHVAAKIVHALLYALMLFMPLSGYLGTGVDTELFGVVTIPRFADTPVFQTLVAGGLGLSFEEFEAPIDWLHKSLGEAAVLALVGVHAAAALFHHFARRDGALARMFPVPRFAQGDDR